METITITVSVHQMEEGRHICKKTVKVLNTTEHSLPLSECSETRPDWGVYHPIVTHPAIERALNRRNVFTPLPANQQYFFGVKRETT